MQHYMAHLLAPIFFSGAENARTAPSKGAIYDELSEQHQNQSINPHIKCPISTFLVQIEADVT